MSIMRTFCFSSELWHRQTLTPILLGFLVSCVFCLACRWSCFGHRLISVLFIGYFLFLCCLLRFASLFPILRRRENAGKYDKIRRRNGNMKKKKYVMLLLQTENGERKDLRVYPPFSVISLFCFCFYVLVFSRIQASPFLLRPLFLVLLLSILPGSSFLILSLFLLFSPLHSSPIFISVFYMFSSFIYVSLSLTCYSRFFISLLYSCFLVFIILFLVPSHLFIFHGFSSCFFFVVLGFSWFCRFGHVSSVFQCIWFFLVLLDSPFYLSLYAILFLYSVSSCFRFHYPPFSLQLLLVFVVHVFSLSSTYFLFNPHTLFVSSTRFHFSSILQASTRVLSLIHIRLAFICGFPSYISPSST